MKKIIYSSLLILFIWNGSKALAQSDMISYGLNKTLPQANNLNPAILPDYKFSFGLPGLSGFHINTAQNFTNLELLNTKDEDGSLNSNNILSAIKRNNRISSNNNINLFHLGIRGLTSYTAVSINTRTTARVSLPREFFQFAVLGNASDELKDGLLDLNRFSTKLMGYTEIGVSHGREILGGKMTAGIRIKYLIGHGYADIKNFDARLRTYGNKDFRGDSLAIDVNQFDIRTAGIAASVSDEDFESDDIRSSVLSNGGFGLDLGATYEFSRKIRFFASLNDLGFINWNSQYATKLAVPSFQYNFSGIDVVELINGEDISVINDFDSVINDLEIAETTDESFATSLTARIYAGASYQLSRRQTASAILYSELYRGTLIPAFTGMYNFQAGTFFNFAFSATLMNGRVNNFGTGVTLNLVPFQIVLATNDLLSIVNPMQGRAVDFRFGINHTFGNVNKGKTRAKKNSKNTIDTIDLGID
ncbi:DUF5723 family protein [uncultured Marivirga sp.]|uniref:DUF5723 family protein n=1 Tax=uncultured Marivirga sp. TaxID=1123707 RepID=UPI0030ED9A46|tara:strand:+ start:119339 stop:120766 length:1428 start_codon:yes stop_codon:yes gene_type:complete